MAASRPAAPVTHRPDALHAAPFATGKAPHNASEVVCLDDGRFLFCDNNVSDSLFEMRLNDAGQLDGALKRHRIRGVSPKYLDDFESMAIATRGNHRFVILSTSLSLKVRRPHARRKRDRGLVSVERESLLRVHANSIRDAQAEIIPGFRDWLLDQTPGLGRRWRKSRTRIPDDGGLNVEGLAWNPVASELQFGLRTPVLGGRPVILRVHVKDIGGRWNLDNFQMRPPVRLRLPSAPHDRGIRTMEFDPVLDATLVVTGNAVSRSKAPFELFAWDGNREGHVRRFDAVRFDSKFRVEGVTPGTIGGRRALVFVDDRGGYAVLWNDDPRLAGASIRRPRAKSARPRRSPALLKR